MKILALDPGYDRCGIAVLERTENGTEALIASDCITTNAKESFERRLLTVIEQLETWMHDHTPDVCALETLFFTTNRKTAMRVAEVRGAIIATVCKQGLELHEYGPSEIKVAITGDGRATKDQMMLMVPQLVRIEKEIQFDDEYDAIAVALTASALLRTGTTNGLVM
jgi:crossover junction endodeoxyribonuclease RuvC